MIPIVAVCGAKNSGKSTLATALLEQHNGVEVAFADPMKRIAMKFGFPAAALWGPSEERERRRTLSISWKKWVELKPVAEAEILELFSVFENSTITGVRDAFRAWVQAEYHYAESIGFVTARHFLQTMGTEFGRSLDKGAWVRYGLKAARRILAEGLGYDREADIQDASRASVRPADVVVISDARFRNEILEVQALGGRCIRIVRKGAAIDASGAHASETEMQSIPNGWFDAVLENDGSLEDLARRVHTISDFFLRPSHFKCAVPD